MEVRNTRQPLRNTILDACYQSKSIVELSVATGVPVLSLLPLVDELIASRLLSVRKIKPYGLVYYRHYRLLDLKSRLHL